MTAATAIRIIKFLKHPENSFQMYFTVRTTKFCNSSTGTSRANLSLLTFLAGFSWLPSLILSKEFRMFPQFADQKLKNTVTGKARIFTRKLVGGRTGTRTTRLVESRFWKSFEDLWDEASNIAQSGHFSLLEDFWTVALT